MPSTSLRARSPSAAQATPKNSENTTIWRISLVAIASTTERGTRWATNSFIDSDATFRLVDAWASGSGRLRLSPGRRMLTRIMPSISDTSDAATNQIIAFAPIRPITLVSPMCATPTTSVENTSGAMIILIRRRKNVRNERDVVRDGFRSFWVGPEGVTGITVQNSKHHADQDYRGELRTHWPLPMVRTQQPSRKQAQAITMDGVRTVFVRL